MGRARSMAGRRVPYEVGGGGGGGGRRGVCWADGGQQGQRQPRVWKQESRKKRKGSQRADGRTQGAGWASRATAEKHRHTTSRGAREMPPVTGPGSSRGSKDETATEDEK